MRAHFSLRFPIYVSRRFFPSKRRWTRSWNQPRIVLNVVHCTRYGWSPISEDHQTHTHIHLRELLLFRRCCPPPASSTPPLDPCRTCSTSNQSGVKRDEVVTVHSEIHHSANQLKEAQESETVASKLDFTFYIEICIKQTGCKKAASERNDFATRSRQVNLSWQ